MHNLEQKLEAILFFKNEPVSLVELSKLLGVSLEDIKLSISNLQKECENRGIVVITDGENVGLGTHPDQSELIESVQKEEFSRELGRAGLETLSIVLYKGPISRREIDYIRGVNSGFILRNLLIRGLVERTESATGERSFSYKPTLKLLEYLGITSVDKLPEYGTVVAKIEEFVVSQDEAGNTDE